MPVTSALNSSSPPAELSMGTTASVNSRIPRPPNHCIRQRHNRMDLGTPSRVERMDTPVVVNADIVSKNASVTDMCVPYRMNGSIPNIDSTTHVRPVSNMASRRPMSLFFGFRKHMPSPAPAVMPTAIRNGTELSVS